MERMDEMNRPNSKSCNQNTDSNAGQLIRDNQENERYTSMFEVGNADWQDRSTGEMGSQRSGGLTSRKMNAEEVPSASSDKKDYQKQDENWNRYGQSPQDIQHAKDDEQIIRKGYSETQETDTNPYLRSMYSSSTKDQLSGNEESIQQKGNRSEHSGGSDIQNLSQHNEGGQNQTSAERYNNQRVTEKGSDQEIGGPMDASKNY